MEIADKPEKLKPVQSVTVKSGDTLSAIAKKNLVLKALPQNLQPNQDLIGPVPDKIQVGQVLIIPFK